MALRVLFLTSEIYPFSKTGGLGDVSGFLPPSLKKTGIDIIVTSPLYRSVDRSGHKLKKLDFSLDVPMFFWTEKAGYYLGFLPDNTPVFFVENDNLFGRDDLYGDKHGDFPDNMKRFSFFTRASLELARYLKHKVDVVHCNDWQTAISPVYQKLLYNKCPYLGASGSLLTVHNLGYQGLFSKEKLFETGFGWDIFKPDILEYYDQINLLKGGLLFADIINTVSKRYAYEIQTPEFGFGLEPILKSKSRHLYGILNGADYSEWNPSLDKYIPAHFNIDSLSKKQICKKELQRAFYLDQDPDIPIIGIVSRLASQKGFDLLPPIMEDLNRHKVQFAILGKGDEQTKQYFGSLPFVFPGKIGYRAIQSEAYAHMIIGGSDFLLMPSRYEPCGLNQMYAMKYGTLPIVRATGGLDDTVFDYNEHQGSGTGFKFHEFSEQSLLDIIKKAIYTYIDRRHHYVNMQLSAMQMDFSWQRSASNYISLYGFAKEKVLKGWY